MASTSCQCAGCEQLALGVMLPVVPPKIDGVNCPCSLCSKYHSGCRCQTCKFYRTPASTDKEEQTEAKMEDITKEPKDMAAIKKTKVLQAEIIRGGKFQIPDGVTLDDAIDCLQRMKRYDEEVVTFQETINCFPWDGAHALGHVLKARFGWASAEPVESWFGSVKPKIISIESGYGKTVQICWGEFSVPGIDGKISCGATEQRGLLCFVLAATIRRKFEPTLKAIADDIKLWIKEQSIYRGQAVGIKFTDEGGERLQMAEVKFLDVASVAEDGLVFPEAVDFEINNYFFTHLERREDVKAHEVPGKWGVLLEGPPGTGKTLAAMVAAKKATRHGITVIYVKEIKDFNEAMLFAVQYAPAVLFCEDIDRIGSGERDAAMDRILNILDGIETKGADVMVVLTSNNAEAIQPVMLRNGRIDVMIHITAPDQVAAQKLLRLYGGAQIAPDTDLTAVGKALDGYNPAAVRSCVDRAKLSAIKRSAPGTVALNLTSADLLGAARSLARQLELINRKPKPSQSKLELGARIIGQELVKGIEVGVIKVRNEAPEVLLAAHEHGAGNGQAPAVE